MNTTKRKGELTEAERLEIAILKEKGYSLRAIARAMARSPNTISYEVQNNSTNKVYDPKKAQAKAGVRKKKRRFQYRKIERVKEVKQILIEKLKAHWNPDEIAGWLKIHHPAWYISKSAIYSWLRTPRGERYCEYLYTERKYVKKHKKKTRRVLIPERMGIEERPLGATNRTRYGHSERDTIVGKKGTPGGLAVLYERKTRFLRARKVGSMRPKEHQRADEKLIEGMKLHSVTRDNGIENTLHRELSVPSYFCDPYSSWQKGGVENVNRMLRRYFPKGTDFRDVTQRDVDRACERINEKPRRSLGYRSAQSEGVRSGVIVKT